MYQTIIRGGHFLQEIPPLSVFHRKATPYFRINFDIIYFYPKDFNISGDINDDFLIIKKAFFEKCKSKSKYRPEIMRLLSYYQKFEIHYTLEGYSP